MFLLLVVMLDRPFSDVQCKAAGYPLHSHLSLSLPLPCVTVCHLISNAPYHFILHTIPEETGSQNLLNFSVSFHQENSKWTNMGVLQKVSALLCFLTLLTKNFKNKLHHFSIQSPCFAMHFFPASYQLFNGISKYVFGWAHSHWCTTAFTSSSHENHLPT